MVTRRFFSVLLALCLVCCLSASALADGGKTLGMITTAPGIYDLSFILPSDMQSIGSTQDFMYGYRNDYMVVGFTLNAETDFDAFYSNRFNAGFATESAETVNGFEARRYTPTVETNVYAIYALQTKKGAGVVDDAFNHRDAEAMHKHAARIRQVMGRARCRSETLTQDFAAPWAGSFASNTGLSFLLPDSMITKAEPSYSGTEVEFANDYLNMLVFSNTMSVDEYIQEYDMNDKEFNVTKKTVNGIEVRVFIPVSQEVSTDLAYVVAVGENGRLQEMIFGATDAAEAAANWQYINAIIDGIH